MPAFIKNCVFIISIYLIHFPAFGVVTCPSITATNVTFTPVAASTSPLNQTQNSLISVRCEGGARDTADLVLSAGLYFNSASRRLFSPATGQFIAYTIKKPDNNNLWGDGLNPVLGTAVQISRNTTTETAYVSIVIPTNIRAGTYTDAVIVDATGTSSATATFTISLTIVDSCSISSPPTPINFGIAPAGATGSSIPQQSATIGMTCSFGLPYFWGADKGNNWSGIQRQLKDPTGANFIAYDLAVNGLLLGDTGMAAFGGNNTTPGLNSRSALGSGIQQVYTINATVAPGVIPSVAGTYNDTVVYTVAW